MVKKKTIDLENLFLRKKPVQMILMLNKGKTDKYFSVLAKEVDCTYSHTVRTLQDLQSKSLLTFEKQGRKKIIKLTKQGKELAENFGKVMHSMKKLK